eukprot:361630-Chlamydomonas_euryale.AAC.7
MTFPHTHNSPASDVPVASPSAAAGEAARPDRGEGRSATRVPRPRNPSTCHLGVASVAEWSDGRGGQPCRGHDRPFFVHTNNTRLLLVELALALSRRGEALASSRQQPTRTTRSRMQLGN